MAADGAGYRTTEPPNGEEPNTMSGIWEHRDLAWSQDDEVVGYDVEAVDGSIGTVDAATAKTGRECIVVDTGPWIFGKKRLVPAGLVSSVDHEERSVTVTLSKDQVRAAPDYDEWDEQTRARHEAHYDS